MGRVCGHEYFVPSIRFTNSFLWVGLCMQNVSNRLLVANVGVERTLLIWTEWSAGNMGLIGLIAFISADFLWTQRRSSYFVCLLLCDLVSLTHRCVNRNSIKRQTNSHEPHRNTGGAAIWLRAVAVQRVGWCDRACTMDEVPSRWTRRPVAGSMLLADETWPASLWLAAELTALAASFQRQQPHPHPIPPCQRSDNSRWTLYPVIG